MKALHTEMKAFIKTISNNEMQKNPELHDRISTLLESMKGLNNKLNKPSKEIIPKSQVVLKYLDEKMLN